MILNSVTPIMVSPPVVANFKITEKEKFCKKHREMQHRYFCKGMINGFLTARQFFFLNRRTIVVIIVPDY